MTIVPYENWMKDQVCQLIVSIQRDEFGVLNQGMTGTPIQISDQPDLLALPESYTNGGGGFWVAMTDEAPARVVGTIGLMDAGHATFALRKMFVHRDFRGKSEVGAPSLAQNLMDTALHHTRTKSYRRILLGTLERYGAALRFYQRNGFTEIAAADLPAYFPRAPHDTKFYDLILPPGSSPTL